MAKERILPQSIEAEQSILGCVLIDQQVPITVFSDLEEDDFYSEVHRILFDAMRSLYQKSTPIDLITVGDYLGKNDLISKIGDLSYLANLTTVVPSASNYKSYIDIIKRCSLMRKLITAGQNIINNTFESGDSSEARTFAEKVIFDIGKDEDRTDLTLLSTTLTPLLEKLDAIYRDPTLLRGLPTGFTRLDRVTNGLQKSDLILIAARPGVGKTSLAMNIATNSALESGAKVAVFNLEMPKMQLAQRILCNVSNVGMEKVGKGEQSKEEWQAIFASNKKLASAKIYIDDSSLNTPIDILSKCRRIKREHGLDLVVVDYLQLMSSGSKNRDINRTTEVSEISRNLKIAAKELNVPVIVLSQLNRAVEGRKDHKPQLSDLRESGAIEQDADIVMFIHKPDMYNDIEVAPENKDICELIIAKHRNGPLDTIKLRWIGPLTSFRSLDKDSNLGSLYKTEPSQKKKAGDYALPDDKDAPPAVEEIDLDELKDLL